MIVADYNMFVRNCYAADENNTLRIDLIDDRGCATHSMVMSHMKRTRTEDNTVIYYVPLKAFKFPNAKEVYFYCSVDISDKNIFGPICQNVKKAKRHYISTASEKNLTELFMYQKVFVDTFNVTTEVVNGSSEEVSSSIITLCLLIGSIILAVTIVVILIVLYKREKEEVAK